MTINNIKTLINTLLIAVLAVTISDIAYENKVFNEVVEIDVIEDVDNHLEIATYQSKLLSIGSGGAGASLFFELELKEHCYPICRTLTKTKLSKKKEQLGSVPYFIRYCSLKIYS